MASTSNTGRGDRQPAGVDRRPRRRQHRAHLPGRGTRRPRVSPCRPWRCWAGRSTAPTTPPAWPCSTPSCTAAPSPRSASWPACATTGSSARSRGRPDCAQAAHFWPTLGGSLRGRWPGGGRRDPGQRAGAAHRPEALRRAVEPRAARPGGGRAGAPAPRHRPARCLTRSGTRSSAGCWSATRGGASAGGFASASSGAARRPAPRRNDRRGDRRPTGRARGRPNGRGAGRVRARAAAPAAHRRRCVASRRHRGRGDGARGRRARPARRAEERPHRVVGARARARHRGAHHRRRARSRHASRHPPPRSPWRCWPPRSPTAPTWTCRGEAPPGRGPGRHHAGRLAGGQGDRRAAPRAGRHPVRRAAPVRPRRYRGRHRHDPAERLAAPPPATGDPVQEAHALLARVAEAQESAVRGGRAGLDTWEPAAGERIVRAGVLREQAPTLPAPRVALAADACAQELLRA